MPDCSTCESPGNTCSSCPSKTVKNGGGCISLENANCYKSDENGCTVCEYGFYMNEGKCLQCVDPFSGVNNYHMNILLECMQREWNKTRCK